MQIYCKPANGQIFVSLGWKKAHNRTNYFNVPYANVQWLFANFIRNILDNSTKIVAPPFAVHVLSIVRYRFNLHVDDENF